MILICCIHVTVSSLLRLRLLRFRWFSCGGSAVAIVLSLLKMALHIVHRLLEVLHVSEGHALGAVAQTFHGIIIHEPWIIVGTKASLVNAQIFSTYLTTHNIGQ